MSRSHRFAAEETPSPRTDAELAAGPGLLALANLAIALKATPRQGWLDRGIDRCDAESVADHSLAVALLAWAAAVERRAAGEELDPARVMALAILHDLPEAEVGDIPPYVPGELPSVETDEARAAFLNQRHVRDAARTAAKHAAEDATMQRLLAKLPPHAAETLEKLWLELREGVTPEARFLKEVDRLEAFLQSRAYSAADPKIAVDSFRQEVAETISDPVLVRVRDAALKSDWPEKP